MEIIDIQRRKNFLYSRRRQLMLKLLYKIIPPSVIDKVHLDYFPYPQYAYGVYLSCMQARMLGHSCTTVIEFGVAGGNGLLALENAAVEIGAALNVEVAVLGFDNGEGMPPSSDVRDMVYWYLPTAFKMDIPRLKARLKKAELFIGPVNETVVEAIKDLRGPIGFCSLDMDYYTATVEALRIFDAPAETRQPRVAIYADDIFGVHDLNLVCSGVGEELAFAEFNATHTDLKINVISGLRHKRPIAAKWNDMMFALHDFGHPLYNTPINPATPDLSTKLNSLR